MIINENSKSAWKKIFPSFFDKVTINKSLHKISITIISHMLILSLRMYIINLVYFYIILYYKSNFICKVILILGYFMPQS